MPINQLIAQGIAPIGRDIPEILFMQRRQQMMQQDMQNDQAARQQAAALNRQQFDALQAQRAEQGKEAARQRAAYPAYRAAMAGNAELTLAILRSADEVPPEVEQMVRENPAGFAQGLRSQYKIDDPEADAKARFDAYKQERDYSFGQQSALSDRQHQQSLARIAAQRQPQGGGQPAAPAQSAYDTEYAKSKARKDAATRAAIDAKRPVMASLEYTANQLSRQLDEVSTGGALGARGMLSALTDYQDTARLENIKQQLSTELRTVFRIPGEGTLSDREQAQYGIQLPDRKYSKEINKQILADIVTRSRLRLQTPDAEPSELDQFIEGDAP